MPAGHDVAALCGNNASSDCCLESERTAHRKHPIANLHALGIAQLGAWQSSIYIDLDHRQIGFGVGANHFGVMEHARRIIVKLDSNAVSFLNHVPVGDYESLGINDHSRTERTLTDGTATRATATGAAEEAIKEIIERIRIVRAAGCPTRGTATALRSLDSGFGIDVDHAGLKLFGNIRKLI